MEIILKQQEESTNSQFNGQLLATRNFINTFGNKAYLIAIQAVVKIKSERVPIGADYLQVCEYGTKVFWIIDNIDYTIALMPEDY